MRIKSFRLTDKYEAVYNDGGAAIRDPVHGFVLIEERDGTMRVTPFTYGVDRFELCESCDNFLGIIPSGSQLPEWMQDVTDAR